MTGTYQLPDGSTLSFSSPKNMALFKKIAAKEIFADLTSIVQGCLDADLLADGDSPIIDSDEFLNHADKHQCPYCAEIISENDLVKDVLNLLEDADIASYEDEDPEFPYLCPVCGAKHHTESAARYCCEEAILYCCPCCKSFVMEDELAPISVPDDAEQWLVVSQWLGESLASLNESVLLTNEGAYLWARAKSEPSPENDPKIAAICATIEILEGQKNYREVT